MFGTSTARHARHVARVVPRRDVKYQKPMPQNREQNWLRNSYSDFTALPEIHHNRATSSTTTIPDITGRGRGGGAYTFVELRSPPNIGGTVTSIDILNMGAHPGPLRSEIHNGSTFITDALRTLTQASHASPGQSHVISAFCMLMP